MPRPDPADVMGALVKILNGGRAHLNCWSATATSLVIIEAQIGDGLPSLGERVRSKSSKHADRNLDALSVGMIVTNLMKYGGSLLIQKLLWLLLG